MSSDPRKALSRLVAMAESHLVATADIEEVDAIESVVCKALDEIERLRWVVEALAKQDPVDTSFAFPRCWHCGGESPNEHATDEHWLEHEDDCTWAAAVAALEGETP